MRGPRPRTCRRAAEKSLIFLGTRAPLWQKMGSLGAFGDSNVSEELEEWRWANAEGVIQSIDEWNLVAALSGGQLPPQTLVWRSGWGEWLPASRVLELSAAIPATRRRTPVEPKRDRERKHPPPLPAGQVKPRPVGNVTKPPPKPPKLPPRRHSPVPPAAPSKPPTPLPVLMTPLPEARINTLPGLAAAGARPPSAPPDAREPIPTLVDMPDATATGTLRPPGAVPPPPRGVPPTPRNFEVLDELPELTPTALDTPIPRPFESPTDPSGPPSSSEFTTQPSAAPTPIPAPDSMEVVTEREALRAFRNRPTEPPTRPRKATPDKAPPAVGPGTRSSQAPIPRRYSIVVFALGTLAGLLAVTVVVLLVTRKPAAERTPFGDVKAQPRTTLPEAPVMPRAPACRVATPANALARAIVGSTPLYLAALEGSARVAVGFASAPTAASGLVLELPGLKTVSLFNRASKDPLVGVVPLTGAKDVTYALDVEGEALRFPRSVDAKPPFTIGLAGVDLVRVVGDNPPDVIWPGVTDERITEVRVASRAGVGHAVTFRRGGQAGSVVFGWLTPDGKKKSELTSISVDGGLSGTPSIAQSADAALVAYAWRPNTDVYWAVQLALAAPGSAPHKKQQFSIPPGGPGAEAISPAVSALPGKRWLVQWTEGSSGARQVRAQVLDAELAPVGKALSLSRADQNAGQGALAAHGNSVLALFLVSRGRGHELWGASLECP